MTKHTIVPKGKTIDKMTCDKCGKGITVTRDSERKRHWRHKGK